METAYIQVHPDDHPDLSDYDGAIIETAGRFGIAVLDVPVDTRGVYLIGSPDRLEMLQKDLGTDYEVREWNGFDSGPLPE